MGDETGPREGQERFSKFLKVFEDIQVAARESAKAAIANAELIRTQIAATNKLVEIVNRSIDSTDRLYEAIVKEKDGLIAAIDDEIMELQGFRDDLRNTAKASGVASLFGPLIDGKRKRR